MTHFWVKKKFIFVLSIILVRNFFISPPKSHRDFHEDLFPDTTAREASMTADEWFSGANNPVSCYISFRLLFVIGTLFVVESFFSCRYNTK